MTDILFGPKWLDTHPRRHETDAAPSRTGVADAPPPSISSAELLQGRSAVQIVHNGAVYRLQATRHGKLILTK